MAWSHTSPHISHLIPHTSCSHLAPQMSCFTRRTHHTQQVAEAGEESARELDEVRGAVRQLAGEAAATTQSISGEGQVIMAWEWLGRSRDGRASGMCHLCTGVHGAAAWSARR